MFQNIRKSVGDINELLKKQNDALEILQSNIQEFMLNIPKRSS